VLEAQRAPQRRLRREVPLWTCAKQRRLKIYPRGRNSTKMSKILVKYKIKVSKCRKPAVPWIRGLDSERYCQNAAGAEGHLGQPVSHRLVPTPDTNSSWPCGTPCKAMASGPNCI